METYGCDHLCEEFWCGWGDWSEWSNCTKSCGDAGVRSRRKTLTIVDAPNTTDEHEHGESKLYELEALKQRFMDLRQGAQDSELRHTQDIIVAFSGGMLCFISLFGVATLINRWRGGARSLDGPLQQQGARYSPVQVSPAEPLMEDALIE